MPMTKDVRFNIKELKMTNAGRKKKRPMRQIMAIALEGAREHGAKIKRK